MLQTVKDRILIFIEAMNISVRQFEIAAGLSYGYVRNLNSQPSVSKMEKIMEAFPQLNRVWLLSGHGEMLGGDENSSIQTVGDNSVAVNNNASTISAPITASRPARATADSNVARALAVAEESQRLLARVIEINEQQQAALQKQQDALLDLLRSKL